MRQRHPVLLKVLTSAGFLGVIVVHGYLVTRLGWPGFLVSMVAGFAWGLMFTFGAPSWLHGLQVLRGHTRAELFSSGEPGLDPGGRTEVPRDDHPMRGSLSECSISDS